MADAIRWGILGAGRVARSFARGLQHLPDAVLKAVASRSAERLREFSALFQVEHLCNDYESLANDRNVDIVYIATTNQLHCEHSILCLNAGKPVLCEKPFTVTAAEARRVIELARRRRLFCMEAMWTRCLPLMRELPAILGSGAIGAIRMLKADFGSLPPFDKENRFFNPALGGGAMLDLGIYLLSLASYLFGPPESVSSQATISQTGVDEQSAALLNYKSGQIAMISCSIVTRLPTEGLIVGTRGNIRIHSPIHCPRGLTVTVYPDLAGEPGGENVPGRAFASGASKSISFLGRVRSKIQPGHKDDVTSYPFEGNGYNYEAQEAMRCLRSQALESTMLPLNETLQIMETMDAIRAQWVSRLPEVVCP